MHVITYLSPCKIVNEYQFKMIFNPTDSYIKDASKRYFLKIPMLAYRAACSPAKLQTMWPMGVWVNIFINTA